MRGAFAFGMSFIDQAAEGRFMVIGEKNDASGKTVRALRPSELKMSAGPRTDSTTDFGRTEVPPRTPNAWLLLEVSV